MQTQTNPAKRKRRNPGMVQDLSLLLVGVAATAWLYQQYKNKSLLH